MKNPTTKTYLFLFLIFNLLGISSIAQDCPASFSEEFIKGNNMQGKIKVNGTLFRSLGDLGFGPVVPYGLPAVSTIFTNGIWLGAKNNNGQFKTAASLYTTNSFDYVAGPIINDNGLLSFDCENFDRLWTVNGSEILQHNADFEDNGLIDNPIPNIYSYPGQGNPFFEDIHGFSLPNTPQGLAPFFDKNNDGIYNPTDGDFPLPTSVSETNIPSQIIWGVFNDGGTNHTISQGEPLNTEIQLTAWTINCLDNEVLNNTIFTSHKLINRSNEDLDSLTFGVFMDYDIGCYTDDYIGSTPDLNTFYGYNADSLDGSAGCACQGGVATFCDIPPAQTVTFLNKEMSSFMYFDNGTSDFESFPTNPTEFYNYMNGRWKNGTPLTFGGNGYDMNTQETEFVFSGNPNDNQSWNMSYITGQVIDKKVIGSSHLGSFNMGDVVTVDMAYSFHQDPDLNNLEVVDLAFDNVLQIQQSYDLNFSSNCTTDICIDDCVWAGDANRDSIVTGVDVLQVGLAYRQTGPQRNSPVIWFPFNGDDWNNVVDGVDLKHTDCNANGEIDHSDFTIIDGTFGSSYKTIEPIDTYPFGLELSFEQNMIAPIEQIDAGDIGRIKLNVNQSDSLYGLSLVIEYDTSFFELFTFLNSFNIWENSSNAYSLGKVVPEKGEIHLATVKTDGTNGLTEIGTATGDIFLKAKVTPYQLVESLIRVKNIKAILNDGTEIDYGATSFLATINNLNGNGTILNDENIDRTTINIFPNPTSNILNVKMENPTQANFTIFDIYGKKVLEKNGVHQSEIQLSTSTFSQGIYFLKIEMDGKEVVKKFIKM